MATKFAADYAKMATSSCKKCKQKIGKQELRIAKIVPNPFSESAGDMKQYFHPDCLFETFVRARSTTKVIETAEDLDGWVDLEQEDKDKLLKNMQDLDKKRGGGKHGDDGESTTTSKKKPSPSKRTKSVSPKPLKPSPKKTANIVKKLDKDEGSGQSDDEGDDDEDRANDTWSSFCSLCDDIGAVGAYTQKTAAVKLHMDSRQKDEAFSAKSLTLLLKLLLPGVVKRVYNVNSKQLIKLYADIFDEEAVDMQDHLNSCGDVSETISQYFKDNKKVKPKSESALSLQEVDDWLEEMTQYTREDDQSQHLARIAKRCTPDDLKYIIREIKHDLRINAGAKHILEALDPDAYTAFQASRDLERVVTKVLENRGGPAGLKKALSVGIQLGVPVLPMLAEACRSVEYALKKCPNGMFAEIKYDGERVQVHKEGAKFNYYSRSLKAVQRHKIQLFEEYIPKAFPGHDEKLDIILDTEVLLVDKNGKPLPFGSLGKHKKEAFKDANVALFVFDCLMFDGVSLMNEPLEKRKQILQKHMKEIPKRILFSEAEFIPKGDPQKALPRLLRRCFNEGLEGLVLKDIQSKYEPGKRHWLKVKKDYLNEGAMADSADLIVLGAYYGTGNKGGLMSVFLMGCYDPKSKTFRTVTKCGNGLDDAGLDKVNKKMKSEVDKISRDFDKLPTWMRCSRQLVPDFVVKDPKNAPVWEICGAEFSKSDAHTADGISIRFPRVTKIRDDKDWDQATNLQELKNLFAKSKEHTDFGDALKEDGEESDEADGKAPAVGHMALNKMFEKWEEAEEKPREHPSPPKRATKPKGASAIVSSDDEMDDDGEETPKKRTPSTSPKKTPPKKAKVAPKRKQDGSDSEEDDVSPKKKKKCEYGAKCYRKNREHKKEFWHPGDEEEEEEGKDKGMGEKKDDQDEPFFDNLKFYLPRNLKKRDDLRRYLVFFGGEITDIPDDAVHILVQEDSEEKDKFLETHKNRVVNVQWAWDSIKKRKVLPTKNY